MNAKAILIILDGWGIAENPAVSAVDQANTPFYNQLIQNHPFSKLQASGNAIGLPEGQVGNSEVGHTNIGAGRIVYQELERISQALKQPNWKQDPEFQKLLLYCIQNKKPLHLIGLVSDGGVHSHIQHLESLVEHLKNEPIPAVYLHVFTDGRDTSPKSGLAFINQLEAFLQNINQSNTQQCGTVRIASLIGRYFAMDRNQNWERISKAYHLLTQPTQPEILQFDTAREALEHFYMQGITDEFIPPCQIGKPAPIQKHDAVLCFNFRTDRCRQITTALTQKDFPEWNMHAMPLKYVTMTQYDANFKGVDVLFHRQILTQTLGEVLQNHSKKQVRIAETEKYPHVTYFFNGGEETPFASEKRILCPSPAVKTYDLKPSMSAQEITDSILPILQAGEVDFICLNFANPDMVGHTGNMQAAISACECVDACLQQVVNTAREHGYHSLIIADHGNADCMMYPNGSPHTSHTLALVPCIWVACNQFSPPTTQNQYTLENGVLGDVAPTLLYLMQIPQPEQMTGKNLLTCQ